jgi:diguanylate cyclase (GGDEF)-like protein/PAS domain S-box-containing protein
MNDTIVTGYLMCKPAESLADNKFKQFSECAPILFFSVDVMLRYTYINPHFAKVHNLQQSQATGKHIRNVIGEAGYHANATHYERVLSGICIEYNSHFIKLDGNEHHYSATYQPLFDNNKVIGFTGVVVDKTAERALEKLTITDPLTNIFNRRKFEHDLHKSLSQFNNQSVMILDIDYFKEVNDKLGHEAGDRVLIKLTNLIVKLIESTGNLYRIGGEEFAFLLDNIANQAQLKSMAEKVRKKIENSQILEDKNITVSLGATFIIQYESREAILKRVDTALYQAKAQGRNQVCLA